MIKTEAQVMIMASNVEVVHLLEEGLKGENQDHKTDVVSRTLLTPRRI